MRYVVVDEIGYVQVDVINCTWGSMWLCFLLIGIDEVVTRSTPTGRLSAIGVNSET